MNSEEQSQLRRKHRQDVSHVDINADSLLLSQCVGRQVDIVHQ